MARLFRYQVSFDEYGIVREVRRWPMERPGDTETVVDAWAGGMAVALPARSGEEAVATARALQTQPSDPGTPSCDASM